MATRVKGKEYDPVSKTMRDFNIELDHAKIEKTADWRRVELGPWTCLVVIDGSAGAKAIKVVKNIVGKPDTISFGKLRLRGGSKGRATITHQG